MVIVSSDALTVVHFENLVCLNVYINAENTHASIYAQVADDSSIKLASYTPDFSKHILNGILQAYYDGVKILYLPEKEDVYGLAVGTSDKNSNSIRAFGVPDKTAPVNPNNLAETFSSIRSKVRSMKKKGGPKC